MVQIRPTADKFKKEESRQDFLQAKVDAALAQIAADIATIDGTPTNADLIAIMRRAIVRQRQIIKYLGTTI